MKRLKRDWFDSADEDVLSKVFRWQESISLAPRFGDIPIGWYQCEHMIIADVIFEELSKRNLDDVYEERGILWSNKAQIMTVKDVRKIAAERMLRLVKKKISD